MTYAVFFDVLPKNGFADAYFGMAGGLKPIVEKIPGFISVERFENLEQADWYLSYSQWADEHALSAWRCQGDHHQAQVCGRNLVLEDYRLRVGANLAEKTPDPLKPCIAALVGEFVRVGEAINSMHNVFDEPARIFRGVINKARGIALFDFNFVDIAKVQAFMKDRNIVDCELYEVERDYGMFNRAQAPSVFA
jgi:heme-degrading monooxygenase HmoA